MSNLGHALGITLGLLAGAGNVLGGFIVARPWKSGAEHRPWNGTSLHALMQLGAGFLLAVTVLETIPYSLNATHPATWAPPLILGGYLLIHLFEHTIAPHFHFGEETHGHDVVSKSAAYSALIGLSVHAMFDGVAIGAASTLSHTLGWLVFTAILLHKIPEGATCASIAMVSGLGKRVAFGAGVALGFATLIGVGVSILHMVPTGAALALASGVTLYVAATDLIPHGNAEGDKRMPLLVFGGVALFALTEFLLDKLGLG